MSLFDLNFIILSTWLYNKTILSTILQEREGSSMESMAFRNVSLDMFIHAVPSSS